MSAATANEGFSALMTAILGGDDILAHRLAHDADDAGCIALVGAQHYAAQLSATLRLDGEELASWWAARLLAEASPS